MSSSSDSPSGDGLGYSLWQNLDVERQVETPEFLINQKASCCAQFFGSKWVKGAGIITGIVLGIIGIGAGGLIVVAGGGTLPSFLAVFQAMGQAGLIGSIGSFAVGGFLFAGAGGWILYLVISHYRKPSTPTLKDEEATKLVNTLKNDGQFFICKTEDGTLMHVRRYHEEIDLDPPFLSLKYEEVEEIKATFNRDKSGEIVYYLDGRLYVTEFNKDARLIETFEIQKIDGGYVRVFREQSPLFPRMSSKEIEEAEKELEEAKSGLFVYHADHGEELYISKYNPGNEEIKIFEVQYWSQDEARAEATEEGFYYLNADDYKIYWIVKNPCIVNENIVPEFEFREANGKKIIPEEFQLELGDIQTKELELINDREGRLIFVDPDSADKICISKLDPTTEMPITFFVNPMSREEAKAQATEEGLYYLRTENDRIYWIYRHEPTFQENLVSFDSMPTKLKSTIEAQHQKNINLLYQQESHIDAVRKLKEMHSRENKIAMEKAACERVIRQIEEEQQRIDNLIGCGVITEAPDYHLEAKVIFERYFPNDKGYDVDAAPVSQEALLSKLSQAREFLSEHNGPLQILYQTKFVGAIAQSKKNIYNAGLYPKYHMDFGGQIVYLSDFMNVGAYESCIAYVEVEPGQFVARLLFRDNSFSSTTWRAAVSLNDDGTFGYGFYDVKPHHVSTHLAWKISNELNQRFIQAGLEGTIVRYPAPGTALIGAIVERQATSISRLEKALYVGKSNAQIQNIRGGSSSQFRSEAKLVSFSGSKKDFPDLSDDDAIVDVSDIAGEHRVFSIPSKSGKYHYLVRIREYQEETLYVPQDEVTIWVYDEGDITSYLTPKNVVKLSDKDQQQLIDELKTSERFEIVRNRDEVPMIPDHEAYLIAEQLEDGSYFACNSDKKYSPERIWRKSSRRPNPAFISSFEPAGRCNLGKYIKGGAFEDLVTAANDAVFEFGTKDEARQLGYYLEDAGDFFVYNIANQEPPTSKHSRINAWAAVKKDNGKIAHVPFYQLKKVYKGSPSYKTIEKIEERKSLWEADIVQPVYNIGLYFDDEETLNSCMENIIMLWGKGTCCIFWDTDENRKAILRTGDDKFEIVNPEDLFDRAVELTITPKIKFLVVNRRWDDKTKPRTYSLEDREGFNYQRFLEEQASSSSSSSSDSLDLGSSSSSDF